MDRTRLTSPEITEALPAGLADQLWTLAEQPDTAEATFQTFTLEPTLVGSRMVLDIMHTVSLPDVAGYYRMTDIAPVQATVQVITLSTVQYMTLASTVPQSPRPACPVLSSWTG